MTAAVVVASAMSFLPFFEARNAGANAILRPPPPDAPVAQATRPDLSVVSKCPGCGGTGELVLKEPNFGQADGRIGKAAATHRKCPVCDGAKRLSTFADPHETAMQVARDFDAYTAAHISKGEVPVGCAYVPREVYESADKKMLKRVEKAFGEPCKKCSWTGLEGCRKCSGLGYLQCPNEECKGGWAVTKTTTSYSRSRSSGGGGCGTSRTISSSRRSNRFSKKETKVTVQVCPVCNGAKIVICPECRGAKASACRKCGGTGVKKGL
jgi:hypothetical protein